MNLSEAEKRMIYQVEGTSQGAALNEIYMTWRYAPDKAMKDTAEGLLKKLRPLSDKECMDVIRDVQKNYRLPSKATPPMSAISRNIFWRRCITPRPPSTATILPWCSMICTGTGKGGEAKCRRK